MKLDKRYLLCYTELDENRIRHSRHAWFLTEEELRRFLEKRIREREAETELAVEILCYRELEQE